MEIINLLTNFFSENVILLAFFGSMIGGEQVILFLASMAGAGLLPLWIVFVFSYFGTLTSDIFWFYFGRLGFANKFLRIKPISKSYEKLERIITRKIIKNYLVGGIILKFAYGIRIATIISLGKEKMSAWKFILSNAIGTLILHLILISVGWMAGKGSSQYLEGFRSYSGVIKVIFIVLIISYLLHIIIKWAMKKWILKEK